MRPLLSFTSTGARIGAILIVLGSMISSRSDAQSITFETTPAGVLPTDDGTLLTSSAYNLPGLQISFGFDTDLNGSVETNAVFEQAGTFPGEGTNVGFQGSSGFDTADSGFGAQLGQYFLRGAIGGANFGKFVIQYTTALTVTEASGEIWDIDGTDDHPPLTEQYRVQAFDASNLLLGTIDSPIGNISSAVAPLDGQPWVFNFTGLSGSIDHIEVTFIGTKPGGIGLAFNNFYPVTAVPEPGSAVAMLGMISLHAFQRARRRRANAAAAPISSSDALPGSGASTKLSRI